MDTDTFPSPPSSPGRSKDPRVKFQTPKVSLDLELTIIKGRALVAKDKHFFTRRRSSDVYVKVYYGGRFCGKTPVVNKNLNPEWGFMIRINVDENDSGKHIEGDPDFTNVICHIWDEDMLSSDDFMGEVKIPLNLDEDFSQSWHRVGTGDQANRKHFCHNATGHLEVRMRITNRKGLQLEKEQPFVIPFERFRVTINWKIESGQKVDLENSCVAIGSLGEILIDESVYFAQMTNPTGSICRSDENLFGGRFETNFHFNQNSVPLWVRAFYFITTVTVSGKTLKDLESMSVKVSDVHESDSARNYRPNIFEEHTAIFLMRISRDQSHRWCLRIIEDWNHTARDFGTLISQIKGLSKDINPDVEINPNERIAIMRPGMSIHIKDYANGKELNQELVFGLKCTIKDEENTDLDTFVICLDESRNVVEIVSNKTAPSPDAPEGSIKLSQIQKDYEDEDEDEMRVLMKLSEVPSNIQYIGVAISSCSGQEIDYNKVKCHLFDPETEMDLALYRISNDPSFMGYTSIILACFYRESSDWDMRAIGKAMVTSDIVTDFQHFICDMPASQPDVVRVNPMSLSLRES